MIQAIGAVMQIGGGIMSAFGKRKAAKAAKKQAEEDAKALEYNAKIVEAQADVSSAEGRESFRREQQNIETKLASVRARLATQGSISNVGAPLAVIGDITSKLELSVLDSYRVQETQRTASYMQADNLRKDAMNTRKAGKRAYKDAKFNILSSLLSTGAQAGSNIYTSKQVNPT